MIENLEGEVWKDIKGFEGYYMVSNMGRVKSLERTVKSRGGMPVVLKSKIKKHTFSREYRKLSLNINGIKKTHTVHRLVADAFIPNPENKPHVNHIDLVPSNNHVSNLEWCTQSENSQHWHDSKTEGHLRGAANPASKLTEPDVLNIFRRRSERENYQSIADSLNVTKNCIKGVLSRTNWKHVKVPDQYLKKALQ